VVMGTVNVVVTGRVSVVTGRVNVVVTRVRVVTGRGRVVVVRVNVVVGGRRRVVGRRGNVVVGRWRGVTAGGGGGVVGERVRVGWVMVVAASGIVVVGRVTVVVMGSVSVVTGTVNVVVTGRVNVVVTRVSVVMGTVNVVVLKVSVVTGRVNVVVTRVRVVTGRVNVVVTRVSVVTGRVNVVVLRVSVVTGRTVVVVTRVMVGMAPEAIPSRSVVGVRAVLPVEASSHGGWSSWRPAIGKSAMLSTSLPVASSGPKAVPPQRFVAPEAQGGIASASASATRPRSPAGPFICTASPVGARSRSPASFIAAPEGRQWLALAEASWHMLCVTRSPRRRCRTALTLRLRVGHPRAGPRCWTGGQKRSSQSCAPRGPRRRTRCSARCWRRSGGSGSPSPASAIPSCTTTWRTRSRAPS